MKKKNLVFIPFLAILIMSIGFLSSCEDDEDKKSSQIDLNSFGPSPNFHNGHLKFIGKNLDKVTSIILPVDVEVTEFITKTSTLIEIEIPRTTAVSGKVILKTPQGDIETKTELGIEEPITITSFQPATLRPGEIVTLTGTYLSLVKEVTFAENKSVTDFESQTETELSVVVPEDARTGYIFASNADEEDLVFFKSLTELTVALPVPGTVTPATIKAGSNLTIAGTDLDLVKDIIFQGGTIVSTFVSQEIDKIVVEVPDNSKDGAVVLRPASLVEIETAPITMVVPTITNVTPAPAKNGQNITITGTNLDLVTSVSFAGDVNGVIQDGGSATSMSVQVPMTAVNGVVTLNTAAGKSVSTSSALSIVVPTVTNFTPTTVATATSPSVTINGTNLDLITEVIFEGDWSTAVNGTSNQIVVDVVPGSVNGPIKLITVNGTEIITSQSLTITPNVPNITNAPDEAFIGTMITLTGTNMNVPSDIIFPGNKIATQFGSKTSTTIEVLVPNGVVAGDGKIKFVTDKNEIYESPEISFKLLGVEPIVDPALIINNFDESGHDLGWDNWAGNVELGSDASVGVSGKYLHGTNASLSGWSWIWGCNHDQLPKVSVTKADHLFKMDVKITTPIPASANFQMELAGTRIDLGNLGGTTPNGGWITITYDLSTFGGLPATIPASGEWGINLGSGTVDLRGLYIDNIRFQAK